MKLERAAWWNLFKTLLFTLVVPGILGGLVPWWIVGERNPFAESAAHPWRYLGLLPLAVGVFVYLRCAWDFATRGLGTPLPLDAPKRLVIQGLYRFVRNPMYVGVGALLFGEVILYGSLALVIFFAVASASWHLFVIAYEEPHLKRVFGEPYEEYCRKVPRWLPRYPRDA